MTYTLYKLKVYSIMTYIHCEIITIISLVHTCHLIQYKKKRQTGF